MRCAQRAQTSTKVKISSKSDPRFESGCMPDRSQNVVDSLLSAWVVSPTMYVKSTSERNDNKSPKIPYSAMVREVEKWSGSVSETGSPPKVKKFFSINRPNHNTKYNWNRLITFSVLLTESWQTVTNVTDDIDLPGGGNNLVAYTKWVIEPGDTKWYCCRL